MYTTAYTQHHPPRLAPMLGVWQEGAWAIGYVGWWG